MENPLERIARIQPGQQRREGSAIGHIAGHHRDAGTGLFQPAHHLGNTL